MPPRFGSVPALAVLALVSLLCSGSPSALAQGAPVDDATTLAAAKESFDQAEKSYALGKFGDALRQYERAFDLKPLPAFLFNIGQCHRNLGNWERASFFYNGYLSRDPKAKNRDKVLTLIDQMNAKVREQDEARRAAAAASGTTGTGTTGTGTTGTGTTGTGTTTPTTREPGVIVPPQAVTPPVTPPVAETPTYRKWWVWTLVGVAVVGGGVAAAVVATNPSVSTANLNGSLGSPIDASR